MTPTVIDTETTGFRDDGEIVEIAAVRGLEDYAASLARPETRPISFGAMATHHITPPMLENAPRLADALSAVGLGLVPPSTVLVMHNAAYDRRYLPPYLQDLPFVCTYRCALHLAPDAESHSNGALFDALMTWGIFEWMVSEAVQEIPTETDAGPSWSDGIQYLVHMTQQPVLLRKVRFGKHSGALWSEVPTDYLQWILRQDFDADVLHTARHWLESGG